MSRQFTFPDYENLNRLLDQQELALTSAEMHGLLSGMLCGGSRGESWQNLMHELTNEGTAFPRTLAEPLRQLHEATAQALDSDDYAFQLFLPDEARGSVFDRADALAGWVNHFLLGLGVAQPKLDGIRGDVREAVDDLRNIAQLGYDEDEDQQSLAQSLEEVVEYVRMAAILCHNEFTRPAANGREASGPTLH
ncbi:YecA/YgfB family protein [Martelella alba]|uniref:UPF0149 protein FCN80_20390 n=1 Tax=Martelella alba TaxID=2590451 RepID=A0ABY2SFL1_9HYPH|nr:YecA family protein [Martelella alba]TKI03775.1 YecA family protein [Martelella alba]